MKYNFIKCTAGSGHRFTGLTVRERQITLTKSLLEKMEPYDYIELSYDIENKAILVKQTPKTESSYKINHKNNGTMAIGCTLFKKMPRGRYHLKEETDDGLIVVLQYLEREGENGTK